MFDALPLLEGDTRSALARFEREGVELDSDLVRHLIDFGVLADG